MNQDTYTKFKDFLRSNLSEWKSLRDDEIDMQRLCSLSNLVFLAKAQQEVSPRQVIFRKFSTQEGVVDREKEALIFLEMSKKGLGPKCFGVSEEYRIEEYVNARPIQNKEFNEPEFRRKLAISLANLHKVNIKGIDKVPLLERAFNDPTYFKSFEDKCNEEIYTPEEEAMIEEIKTAVSKEEIEFISKILPKDDPVFCHNDLLGGNILIRKEDNAVVLIDFEYGSYNFRGYDIGNMFKESTIDYSYSSAPYFQFIDSYFPSDDELREFLQYYIVYSDMPSEEQKKYGEKLVLNHDLLLEYIEQNNKSQEFNKRIENLFRETKIGALLSHYYWMIWAVKMCKQRQCDFDYLAFAYAKYGYYRKLKEELQEMETY